MYTSIKPSCLKYELKFWYAELKIISGLIFQKDSAVASIFCIVFVVLYIITFATGPGSIPWFLVSELFSQSARPTAASLAVFTNWFANFLVGLTFLPIKVSYEKPDMEHFKYQCDHYIINHSFFRKRRGQMFSLYSLSCKCCSLFSSGRKYLKRKINLLRRFQPSSDKNLMNKIPKWLKNDHDNVHL